MTKFKDGLIGLVVGDAIGLPLLNTPREVLLKEPVFDMYANKEFNTPKGTTSLPTEYALLIKDLLDNKLTKEDLLKKLIEVEDYIKDNNIKHIHLGKTTLKALEEYKEKEDISKIGLIDINDNGSGALLMMYPIAYYACENKLSENEILNLVSTVTESTHNQEINILGCFIYTMYLLFLLRGKDKYASLSMLQCCDYSIFSEETISLYESILKNSLKDINIDNINTNGYIISSVESSIYIILNSDNYTQSILGAINLGEKTNVIASLVGTMAGIIYGIDSIKDEWIESIQNQKIIEKYINE